MVSSFNLSWRFIFFKKSFYFPGLNRNQAEALLSGHDNGVFLIRDSVLFSGRLTLSFVNNDSFEHYIIETYRNNVTIDNKLWFSTVNDLIKVGSITFIFYLLISRLLHEISWLQFYHETNLKMRMSEIDFSKFFSISRKSQVPDLDIKKLCLSC